jgi:hypothetical protein
LIGAPLGSTAYLVDCETLTQGGAFDTATGAVLSISGFDGDALGAALTISDVNGDGRADLILGAPASSKKGMPDFGAVYVVFGSDELAANLDLAQGGADMVLFGRASGDHFGDALAAGDITGDGIADLLIGAPDSDSKDRIDAGAAYALAGGKDLAGEIDLAADGIRALTVVGAEAGDHLGSTVAAGRQNSDQTLDFLIGAPGALGGKGWVSIVYGSESLISRSSLDTSLDQENVRVIGASEGDGFGWTIGAANLGARYLIVGAPGAGRGTGFTQSSSGKLFLVPQAVPIVTLTAPNGGEVIEIGRNFTISWTAEDEDDNIASFALRLSTDGGLSFPIQIASSVSGTASTFTWQVSAPFTTFNAKIRVTVADTDGGLSSDDSDGAFTIIDQGVPVTLTSPNGGEVISFGSVVQVNWTVPSASRNRISDYSLFFSSDGGRNFTQSIATGIPGGASSFSWQVPPLCASNVRVLVVATTVTGARTNDSSDGDITMRNPGPPVDVGRMFLDAEASRLQLNIGAIASAGSEILFSQGTLVEFSNEDGTEFKTFNKIPKIKKGGARLITRGQIDGVDLLEFFPIGDTRIMKVTTPACGVTQINVRRFGFQLFAQQ